MKHKPKGTMPTIKEWLKEVKSKTKNKCIPHVDVGEDVEQISLSIQQRAADKLNRGEKPYIASKVYVDYLNTIIEGFKSELSKANKKEFTEDDLRKAFNAGMICYQCDGNEGTDEESYIKSLQPKIESIEPETVVVSDIVDTTGDTKFPVQREPKYITYQRDGKTYIKAKVNYEKS